MKWFYRYVDLQVEDIAGRVDTPSELSRARELWPCQHTDKNAAALLVGRFLVMDLSVTKVTKEKLQEWVDQSEHHFFWRKKVDTKLRKVLE